jgi:hypothetical protein
MALAALWSTVTWAQVPPPPSTSPPGRSQKTASKLGASTASALRSLREGKPCGRSEDPVAPVRAALRDDYTARKEWVDAASEEVQEALRTLRRVQDADPLSLLKEWSDIQDIESAAVHSLAEDWAQVPAAANSKALHADEKPAVAGPSLSEKAGAALGATTGPTARLEQDTLEDLQRLKKNLSAEQTLYDAYLSALGTAMQAKCAEEAQKPAQDPFRVPTRPKQPASKKTKSTARK